MADNTYSIIKGNSFPFSIDETFKLICMLMGDFFMLFLENKVEPGIILLPNKAPGVSISNIISHA